MPGKGTGPAYYMISAVARRYSIHPQTLRLYEREGLLKPSRTEGNTRLYSDADLAQLETILALTRDLGVNLAGVEIILDMRTKMDRMQREVNEFMAYAKRELASGLGDWEQRLGTALVRSSPTDLVRTDRRAPAGDREKTGGVDQQVVVKVQRRTAARSFGKAQGRGWAMSNPRQARGVPSMSRDEAGDTPD